MSCRISFAVAAAVVITTACAREPEQRPIQYPETKTVGQTDTYHGVVVADPYRWLEQDVREAPDVASWVAAQNAVTFEYLGGLAQRETIETRLTQLWNYEKFQTPSMEGGRYWFRRNNGLQNQYVLYSMDSLDAEPKVVIDPNTWSDDGTVALSQAAPGPTGRYLGYTIQDGGSDWRTARVMDLESGALLPETLEWLKFTGLVWRADGSGFYYSRYPVPQQGAEFQSLNMNQAVYFHKVGTPQSEDQLIYERPDNPDWGFFASESHDGRHLVIHVWKGTDDRNQLVYKDMTKPNSKPTILYGYGGFYISLTPNFSITQLAWMEMGGVYAIANLRGGGEYGEAWHKAGTKLDKQNVFDDFIAAGEYLVAEDYTSPEHLGIFGGSNGGLLVGAVTNQRPDLFGAAIPAVGVMDMLRFHQFTAGRFWTDDYGSADNEDEFHALYAYSPYHNIKDGVCYPPVMATTADTDDRVVPGHTFKYIARLQAAQGCANPVLVRIETRAGHGAGTPTAKIIAQYADRWAYLMHHLGG